MFTTVNITLIGIRDHEVTMKSLVYVTMKWPWSCVHSSLLCARTSWDVSLPCCLSGMMQLLTCLMVFIRVFNTQIFILVNVLQIEMPQTLCLLYFI